MRIKIVILLFSLIATTTFSQSSFAPIGTIWNYWFQAHNGGYSGQKSLVYEKDTMINSLDLKLIKSNWYYTIIQPMPPISGGTKQFIFERNDSIFEYLLYSDSLRLLYSFSMPINDSIVQNPDLPSIRTSYTLDSIANFNICNSTRNAIYYSTLFQDQVNYCTSNLTVVNQIGPIDDYLFLQGNPNCQMTDGTLTFVCVNTGTCVYPNFANCSYIGLTKKPNNFFQLSQNENLITLTFEQNFTGDINLTDITGRVLKSSSLFNEDKLSFNCIDLKGIYILQVNSNNSFSTIKLALGCN